MANNLAKLCSSSSRKVELLSHEIGYLAEGISKQNIEAIVWFLLNAYSKMQEERDESKKELLGKKEPELKLLENS